MFLCLFVCVCVHSCQTQTKEEKERDRQTERSLLQRKVHTGGDTFHSDKHVTYRWMSRLFVSLKASPVRLPKKASPVSSSMPDLIWSFLVETMAAYWFHLAANTGPHPIWGSGLHAGRYTAEIDLLHFLYVEISLGSSKTFQDTTASMWVSAVKHSKLPHCFIKSTLSVL